MTQPLNRHLPYSCGIRQHPPILFRFASLGLRLVLLAGTPKSTNLVSFATSNVNVLPETFHP